MCSVWSPQVPASVRPAVGDGEETSPDDSQRSPRSNVSDLGKKAEGTQGWVELLTPLKIDQGFRGLDKLEKRRSRTGKTRYKDRLVPRERMPAPHHCGRSSL